MDKRYICKSFPHFLHGGDYNPEQWIGYPGIWDEDMRLMRLAGCNEMTVGIFAWSTLEPREGEYDFSFLDEIIEKIWQNGGRVILATPSGARPHWLADRYPEVLRVDANGIRNRFGARHNHCYTSPVYREKVSQINRRLAERYGRHPAVIAWHVSNEYNGDCHCALCTEAFRSFLREKYEGDIGRLNHAYWTTFWSHTYGDFSEIDIPSPRGEMMVHGLNLDYRRFVTHQTVDFMRAETLPLRELSDLPITTNMMPHYKGLNYKEFTAVADFASIDVYPNWHDGNELVPAETAFWYDYYRCLFDQPFLLMESAPGTTNWKPINKLKRPSMDRLASLQAVAHGSDSVQYFQFRKSRGSSEKFHGAIVDHVGHENTRVFREVARTGEMLRKIDRVCGTATPARVAMICDYESMWALDDAQGFTKEDKKYFETLYRMYHALWRRGINVDVIDAKAPLDRYALVIAPMLYMTGEGTIEALSEFVRRGGVLYATYLLGMVDESDLCHLGGFPGGMLKETFGIWNEEIDALYPGERVAVAYGDERYSAVDLCECVHPRGAEVLATYTDAFYAGMPALTRNAYGKGKAYYQACRDTGELFDRVIGEVLSDLEITSPIGLPLPNGVTVHHRTDGEARYLFVENHSSEAERLTLSRPYLDLETGETVEAISLSPYDVRILCDA